LDKEVFEIPSRIRKIGLLNLVNLEAAQLKFILENIKTNLYDFFMKKSGQKGSAVA